jgi:hypothetical protein
VTTRTASEGKNDTALLRYNPIERLTAAGGEAERLLRRQRR